MQADGYRKTVRGPASGRGFMALFAMLAMGLGLMARPAAAQPFAYVTDAGDGINPGTVAVIDTATNMTVGSPITVGIFPLGVAVTPDGTRVYVANQGAGPSAPSNIVSVIDTTKNPPTVATVTVGNSPVAVAITPDGSDTGTKSVHALIFHKRELPSVIRLN